MVYYLAKMHVLDLDAKLALYNLEQARQGSAAGQSRKEDRPRY